MKEMGKDLSTKGNSVFVVDDVNKKRNYLFIGIFLFVVFALVFFLFIGGKSDVDEKEDMRLKLVDYIDGGFSVESVVEDGDFFRVMLSFENRSRDVCGEDAVVSSGVVFVAGDEMVRVSEKYVRGIFVDDGDVESVEFGDVEVVRMGGSCNFENVYKVFVKLKEEQDGNTHKEFIVDDFGNVLYSRLASYGVSILGGDDWSYSGGSVELG